MKCKILMLFGLALFFILLSCEKTVKAYECEECEVLTENRIPLDVRIYKRKSSLTDRIGNRISTNEYTLVLDNSISSLEAEDYWLNPKKLIFYPEFFLVALPNYEIKEEENYILHKDIGKERFNIIKADTVLRKEGEDAIYEIEYSKNQIKFNSFGELKKYCDFVILKY
ncbi:hypothetical protein ACP6L2_14880 [Sphingobacterium lactis]|uniref:hypothetical protein n=1 Tax=Sphingobacterium lactis TaxID=797291 RepID=UPI003F7EBB8D